MKDLLEYIMTDEYTFFGTIGLILSLGLALNWALAGIRGKVMSLLG